MGLVFDDNQIKNMSKDIILLPFVINDTETGYVGQKLKVIASKESFEKADSDQKVFSDFWIDTVSKYHSELYKLNAVQKTNYLDSNIINGGNQIAPHFNTSWFKLAPQLTDSNNGLPSTNTTNRKETDVLNDLIEAINLLKNGFNDGTTNDLITDVTNNSFKAETTLPAVGTRAILTNGTKTTLVKILSVTTPPPVIPAPPVPEPIVSTITFEYLGGDQGSEVGSGNYFSYHSGYNNSQRSHLGTIESLMLAYEARVISKTTELKNWLNDEKTIVDSNGDLAPRKTQNQNTSTNLLNAINEITTWEAMVVNNASGKFTDTGLAHLVNVHTNRNTQVTARITEITNSLGSVSQDGDGNISGSGCYFNLMTVINLRISKGTGTLFNVNQMGMAVGLFDKKIADGNTQLAQYQDVLLVTRLTNDTTIGQIEFDVEANSGFSVGDIIKIMDNDSNVYQRNVTLLPTGKIRLNSGVPVELKINSLARIVKMK